MKMIMSSLEILQITIEASYETPAYIVNPQMIWKIIEMGMQ